MSERDQDNLNDLDEDFDADEEEAELVSATEGFMDHMESSTNHSILAEQGVEMVQGNFKFTGLDEREHELTLKQKLFCEAYLQHKGNGVDAVISAGYDVRKKDDKGEPIDHVYNRKLAAVIASQNLIKLNITAYIQKLYERYGFSDKAVEREHLFLINQQQDLKTKKAAIDMFYNLNNRYPAKKVDLSSMGEKIVGINMVVPQGAEAPTPDAGTSNSGQT